MLKNKFTLLSILILFMFSNCKNETAPDSNYKKNNSELVNLVKKWNEANNSKNISEFLNLYHDTVFYYGRILNKNQSLINKLNFFDDNSDFYQQIYGDIDIEEKSQEIKCSFIKRVVLKSKTSDYASYLVFKKINNKWRIIKESDLNTEKIITQKAKTNISNQINYTCGETNFFIGKFKLLEYYDVAWDTKRDAYFIIFGSPINMINTNKYDDCRSEDKIMKSTLFFEEENNLDQYLNKDVIVYGSIGSSPTGHYSTGTLIDVKEIKLLK